MISNLAGFLFIMVTFITMNNIYSLNQNNIVISSTKVAANAVVDNGNSVANSNSNSEVASTTNTKQATHDPNSLNGDVVISLSDSATNASNIVYGNSLANSTSNAQAIKSKISDSTNSGTQPDSNELVMAQAVSNSEAATAKGGAASNAVSNSFSASNSISDTPTTSDITTDSIKPNCLTNYDWSDLGIKARAISVNSSGTMFYIGVDGLLYKFGFIGRRIEKMRGDISLRELEKLSVGPNNNLFLVSTYGDGYYLSSDNSVKKLDGCYKDITVTSTGDVYKLGCEMEDSGYPVHRLICNWDNYPTCDRTDLYTHENCRWFKLDFYAIKISVSTSGVVYLIDSLNDAYVYDGMNMSNLGLQIKANDLDISNDGIIYVAGSDNMIYKRSNDGVDNYICEYSDATSITIGPFNMPFIISENSSVYFTQKYGFN